LTNSNIPHGCNTIEYVGGSTSGISPYALFDWYQPVYYLNPSIDFPQEVKKIRRLIGDAEQCTHAMAYVILAAKGITAVHKYLAHKAIKEKPNLFDACINAAYAADLTSNIDADLLDIQNLSEDETTLPADSEDHGIECHN
jgi:hypothetical protein